MATNLAIDQELLAEAMTIGKLPTKKATVNEALREFVQRRKQLEAIEMFGKFDFDPDYDYKAGRRKDRSRIMEDE
ncbi:MAG: type II toxin-antitoxin system VapB family antitoxin [Planctomycetes bacterium]|nr:type II toxin-antitoxin system VapB family antitoxin [Planctomycetota bacterium]